MTTGGTVVDPGAVSIFFDVLFTLISNSLPLALIGSVGLMIAFHHKTLPRRADLLLEPAVGAVAHFGLPDSGQMPTVIAPDLSSLPSGEKAIDPTTGEEFTRNV